MAELVDTTAGQAELEKEVLNTVGGISELEKETPSSVAGLVEVQNELENTIAGNTELEKEVQDTSAGIVEAEATVYSTVAGKVTTEEIVPTNTIGGLIEMSMFTIESAKEVARILKLALKAVREASYNSYGGDRIIQTRYILSEYTSLSPYTTADLAKAVVELVKNDLGE